MTTNELGSSPQELPKYIILEEGHHYFILKRQNNKAAYYKYLSCGTLVQAQHDAKALDAYE